MSIVHASLACAEDVEGVLDIGEAMLGSRFRGPLFH